MDFIPAIPFSSASTSFTPIAFRDPSTLISSIPYLFGFGPMLQALLTNPWFLESFRFLILGSIIETGRRLWQWILNNAKNGIFITGYFTESDMAYEWLDNFSRAQPQNSLAFKVSATYDDDSNLRSIDDDAKPTPPDGDIKPTVLFDSGTNNTHFFRFQGTWVNVEKGGSNVAPVGGYSPWSLGFSNEVPIGTMRVTLYTRRKDVLEKLVEAARLRHLEVRAKPKLQAAPSPYGFVPPVEAPKVPMLVATFNQGDPAYSWVDEYLDTHCAWGDSRNLTVKAKTSGVRRGIDLGQYHYEVAKDAPYLFLFRNVWVQVARLRGNYNYATSREDGGSLTLTFHTLKRKILDDFIELARAEYGEKAVGHVTVHMASFGAWNKIITKPRRPFESIILEDDIKEMLLSDAKQFYESEEWYASAGIPHRRGYLLYGPPGTGKSSTVHALAGELGLEIYVLSLSDRNLDDFNLQNAVEASSMNSILLIEDIDCAFPNRDNQPIDGSSREGHPREDGKDSNRNENEPRKQYSQVTLSGLLNVLDSVTSVEGRLLFVTTNYIDELDEALIRPGRVDTRVQFKLASKDQVRKLFERFYPSTPPRSLLHKQSPERIAELAEAFAATVPEEKYSVAQLQGFLLTKKSDPEGAAKEILGWMKGLEAEKEEREARLKERLMKKAEKRLAEKEAAKAAEEEVARRAAAKAEEAAASSENETEEGLEHEKGAEASTPPQQNEPTEVDDDQTAISKENDPTA